MNELELYILVETHIKQCFLDKGSFTRIQNLTQSPVSSGCKYLRETWKGKVACLDFWLCVFLLALNLVLNHWTFCLDVIVFIPWLFSYFISLWLHVFQILKRFVFAVSLWLYVYEHIYASVSGGQKMVTGSSELELTVILSLSMWMLGTWPPPGVASILTYWTIFSATLFILL